MNQSAAARASSPANHKPEPQLQPITSMDLLAALADPATQQQALEQINRSVLDAAYEFRPGAPLEPYLKLRIPEEHRERNNFSLAEVRVYHEPVT